MILHGYFARRYVGALLMVLALFFAIFALLDLIDSVPELSAKGAGFWQVAGLTLLAVPRALYQILPLIVILSSVLLFLSLARSSELVVSRAAGRSALRALIGPGAVVLMVGVLGASAINPIVAATSREYEARRAVLTGADREVSSLGNDGLWLRQGGIGRQTVIHARSANADGTVLGDVMFLTYGEDGTPLRRIEATTATLGPTGWELGGAKSWPLANLTNPERLATQTERLTVPSTLTRSQIRDSFGSPQSVAIWDLPAFITRLEAAGFSARAHRIWLQSELAMPVFLLSMMLVAAGFTMRHQRAGRTGIMTLGAILSGFGLYFIRNFAQILGENAQIPVLLAAWAPPLAALLLALGLLLHKEDG